MFLQRPIAWPWDPMFNRWLYRFYNAAILLLLPGIVLWIAVRWRRRFFSKGLDRWSERWGRLSAAQRALLSATRRRWWVHAVSLGEIKAIETFLNKAPAYADVQIVLSVVTPEAVAYAAERRLADLVLAAPIDLPWVVRRVIDLVRPELFVSVESEFWPNLLREAKRSGAKVALINGRLSERSYNSYRRFRRIMQAIWDCFDLWAVRQEQDAGRFKELGVAMNKLVVTGNLKYDVMINRPSDRAIRNSDPARPVVVFGSTREGEEVLFLPVVQKLRATWPQLKVIWAPRHLERLTEVEQLLGAHGCPAERKSRMQGANVAVESPDVLWDSMGDLLDAYRQADVAVVGGSFVLKGGQNPIEPAALGVPVIFGPSMENFNGIAELLVRGEGARQVVLDDLERTVAQLLGEPSTRRKLAENGRRIVETSQGATQRTLDLLSKLTRQEEK